MFRPIELIALRNAVAHLGMSFIRPHQETHFIQRRVWRSTNSNLLEKTNRQEHVQKKQLLEITKASRAKN